MGTAGSQRGVGVPRGTFLLYTQRLAIWRPPGVQSLHLDHHPRMSQCRTLWITGRVPAPGACSCLPEVPAPPALASLLGLVSSWRPTAMPPTTPAPGLRWPLVGAFGILAHRLLQVLVSAQPTAAFVQCEMLMIGEPWGPALITLLSSALPCAAPTHQPVATGTKSPQWTAPDGPGPRLAWGRWAEVTGCCPSEVAEARGQPDALDGEGKRKYK